MGVKKKEIGNGAGLDGACQKAKGNARKGWSYELQKPYLLVHAFATKKNSQ